MHGAPPDLFPTEATAGLRRKNAHFVNLESLLGGVAIAPRYPAPAGNKGTRFSRNIITYFLLIRYFLTKD